jgi:hypothetical protein
MEKIMSIIVLGLLNTLTYLDKTNCPDHPEALLALLILLNTLTYLDKTSCPDHPEALLALLITCQPFLCT